MIASINLSRSFAETIGVVVLGDVIYWMVLRWFSRASQEARGSGTTRADCSRSGSSKLLAIQDDEENSRDHRSTA